MDVLINVVIGGIITIGIALIGQLGAMIWWMSKVNTTLQYIEGDVKLLFNEAEKREQKRDNEMQAMWKRIDEIKGKY